MLGLGDAENHVIGPRLTSSCCQAAWYTEDQYMRKAMSDAIFRATAVWLFAGKVPRVP